MKHKKKTSVHIKGHATQGGFLKALTDRKVVWSLRCLRFSPGGAPPPNYLPPSRCPCGCRLQRPAVDTNRNHRVRGTLGRNNIVPQSCCVYATLAEPSRCCVCFIALPESPSVCHKVLWLTEGGRLCGKAAEGSGGAPEGKHVSRSGCAFVSMVSGRTGIQRAKTVFTGDSAPLTQQLAHLHLSFFFFPPDLNFVSTSVWLPHTTCTYWWKHTANPFKASCWHLLKLIIY